ncbi:MAG: hypothetical protein AB7N91_27150 [Candidatus Tectimicrobiota bacterium]
MAGKRWRSKHAAQVALQGVTLLGDGLYSNQPYCAMVRQQSCHFICMCKPDSHPKFYERVALWQAADVMTARETRQWNGRSTAVTHVRSLNDVL